MLRVRLLIQGWDIVEERLVVSDEINSPRGTIYNRRRELGNERRKGLWDNQRQADKGLWGKMWAILVLIHSLPAFPRKSSSYLHVTELHCFLVPCLWCSHVTGLWLMAGKRKYHKSHLFTLPMSPSHWLWWWHWKPCVCNRSLPSAWTSARKRAHCFLPTCNC